MRIVFLGHACHLVEVGGRRILTDPWLVDPIFEGAVEHAPPLGFGPADLPPLNCIALTHGHLDHFNAPTLAALPDKSVPVVHPPGSFTELATNLRLLGFTQLVPRKEWEPFDLDGVQVVPTPSQGVLEECAYLVRGPTGSFWDGADAPQPPELVAEIAARYGPIDAGAFCHNSFDMPALLGIPSHKPPEHATEAGVRSARLLGCRAALAAASSMRWCGPDGAATTRKVIRRSREDFHARLAGEAAEIQALDLAPGDAWSREGGVERGVVRGTPAPRATHDYVHPFLGTGARWCPDGRPGTEDAFRRDLPVRLAAAPELGIQVGQPVFFDVVGADSGAFTVDFRTPGAAPEPGDAGAPFAVRLRDEDWKDLFERRTSWQVLLSQERVRVLRFRPGPPPDGLHFVYALQTLFP